jgi:hypothetical protein
VDLLGPAYAIGMSIWNAGKSFTDNSAYDLNGNVLSDCKLLGNAGQNFGGRSFDLLDDMTLGAFSGEGLVGKSVSGITSLKDTAIDKLGLSPETSSNLKGLLNIINPLQMLQGGIKDSGLLIPGLTGGDTAKVRNAYFNNNPDKSQSFVDNNTLIKWALEHKYELSHNDTQHGGFDDAPTILKIIEDQDFNTWKQVHPKEQVGNYSNNWRQAENFKGVPSTPGVYDSMAYFGNMAAEGIKNKASDIYTGTKNVVSNAYTGVKNKAADVWSGVKNTASNVYTGTKNVVSNAYTGVKNTASNVWSGAKNLGTAALAKTQELASNAWSSAKSLGSAALDKTKNAASNVLSGAKNLASNALDYFTGWYAKGTDNASGGMSVVGEKGPELLIPRNEKMHGRALVNAFADGTTNAPAGAGKIQLPFDQKMNSRGLVNAIDSPDTRGLVNKGLTEPYGTRGIVNAFADGTTNAPAGAGKVELPFDQKVFGRAIVNNTGDSADGRMLVNKGLTDPYGSRGIVNAFADGTTNAPMGAGKIQLPFDQKLYGRALVNAVDSPDGRGIVNAFAKGTTGAPGGPSLVGERGPEIVGENGPEIVNLKRGAQVIPNDKLPQISSSFANGTPNVERLINQIQSEGINSGIPVQARLSDMLSSDNANQVVNASNIRPNAPQTLQSDGLMNSMNTNTKLLNELNNNLKSYLQNSNNQSQNINLIVDGRQLANTQFRREQNRKGMKPNDLV